MAHGTIPLECFGWTEVRAKLRRATRREVNMKEGFSRRSALKGIGGALAAASLSSMRAAESTSPTEQHRSQSAPTGPAASRKHAGKPNILWITGEGVPVSALSGYGSKLIQTPNIDRIAN